MTQQELLDQLTRLRAELAAQPDLDDGSRTALRSFVSDLERIAERQPAAAVQQSTPASSSIGDQWRDALADFEGRHPTLSGALSGFIDRLVDMGI
jgi:hypothetical protein